MNLERNTHFFEQVRRFPVWDVVVEAANPDGGVVSKGDVFACFHCEPYAGPVSHLPATLFFPRLLSSGSKNVDGRNLGVATCQ